MNRAVFLDRDNTLIHADQDVGDLTKVRLIRGAASAVASLRGLGFKIVVATNQGGVARGTFGEAEVAAVNERVAALIAGDSGGAIDAFYYCPYDPAGSVEPYNREHAWRKPRPGMLAQAAEDMNLDLSRSWMIGDRMTDVQAGHAAGAKTVLLRGERDRAGEKNTSDSSDARPDHTVRNLIEAVRVIGEQPRSERTMSGAPERNVERSPGGRGERPSRRDERGSRNKNGERSGALQDSRKKHQDPGSDPVRREASASDRSSRASAGRGSRRTASAVPAGRTRGDATPDRLPDSPATAQTSTEPSSASPAHSDMPRPAKANPAESNREHELSASTPDENAVHLLRQIHRELKSRRADYDDFSFNKMLSGIFQMLTIGCVVFALFNLAAPTIFFQWMSAALLGQLAVLTLLIIHGQR